MHLAEIGMVALDAIQRARADGQVDGDVHMMLKVRGRWGKRTHARLGGRRGPLGRIVSDAIDPPGWMLVEFNVVEVLEFIRHATEAAGRVVDLEKKLTEHRERQ